MRGWGEISMQKEPLVHVAKSMTLQDVHVLVSQLPSMYTILKTRCDVATPTI